MKNTNGRILLNIFGKLSRVYRKYILKLCPSSDTKSKKLTACITQTISEMLNEHNKKSLIKSVKNLLKIIFFIEIYKN
tara:strand:+ start:544 stop:777 length:234 start_codon:yes stop_codon:yes gene_type:complete